jgi:hypothetical protein
VGTLAELLLKMQLDDSFRHPLLRCARLSVRVSVEIKKE